MNYKVRGEIQEYQEQIREHKKSISRLKDQIKEAYKKCPHENASYFSEGIWNWKVWRCPDCGYEE